MKLSGTFSQLSSAPFKALFPALIGLTAISIKQIVGNSSFHASSSNFRSDEDPNLFQKEGLWLIKPISEALESLGEAIFASYNNYFTFMLMMLLVNIIIQGSLKDIKRYFEKKTHFAQGSAANQRTPFLKSLLKSFLIYSLIYCFYQVMWISLAGFFSGSFLPETLTNSFFKIQYSDPQKTILPGRILEEEESFFIDQLTNNVGPQKKPSLSIGKVMSEIDANAYSIKLSRDGKTLFVATNYPPALKIIDITDSEFPVVLSLMPLVKGLSDVLFRSMILSPYETKIYISNFEYLEIIDISDFKLPIYLAKIQDEIIFNQKEDYEIDGVSEPNLLMSKDGKFLFVSGFGLQVFDISDTSAPALINSVPSFIDYGKLIPSSIALSQDGRKLYYTDGGFWIYNVEYPREMSVINSFNTTDFLISSMILSKDYKTAFLLGLDSEESNILFQKLDISDIYSIKEEEIIQIDQMSVHDPVFLNPTPENTFLLIRFTTAERSDVPRLLVFDTQERRVLNHEKNLVTNDDISVLFTEDYKKVFIGSPQKLRIVDLYLDFPNKNAFSNSSSVIRTLETQLQFWRASFASSNEKILYSVSGGGMSASVDTRFGIHKFSASLDQFSNVSFYEPKDNIQQIVISHDNRRAFLMGTKTVYILDISNPKVVTLTGKYGGELGLMESFLLSRDDKTGFLIQTFSKNRVLKILDFSDAKSPVEKGFINLGEGSDLVISLLSKDERTIFIASHNIDIYNVSDHSSPTLLAQIPFLGNELFMAGIPELALSSDGKTLFFKDPSSAGYFTIKIIDVSDVTSPKNRSEFRLPRAKSNTNLEAKSFEVSGDSRTLYILRDFSLIALDVSNMSSPRYLGAIKIDKEGRDSISTFKLSNDGRKVFFFTKSQKCLIASLEPVYTSYVRQDIFLLGERYNIDLQVLKMDKNFEYNQLEGEYRFSKFGLVESRSIMNPNFENVIIKPAPSWMNFDLKNNVLTVESKRKTDIGTYRVYFAFSARLPKNLFSKMNDTEDLFPHLLALAYVDNQLFLTENFGEYEDFILPIKYYYVRKEIYRILKQYCFETFNEINLVQSLSIATEYSNKLKINTPSGTNLKVEISLEAGGKAKFLSRYYGSLLPTITNDKSRLVFEGNLKDINGALEEVVIQLFDNHKICHGKISVSDRLNPIMQKDIKGISNFFEHNLPPERNHSFPLTIQDQIKKELVYTGRYFQIKFNPQTFHDEYTDVENLDYHMVLMEDHNETVLPPWLSFSDMTLMGTPPEIVFGRDFDLKLIVKNEFLEFREPVRLHVKISSSYVLTLLVKYGPYVLTVIGLYIKANLIYNILAKKKYKHAKDFYVGAGEEITPEVIFPISFVAEERQEAKKILKLLEGSEGKLDKTNISETIKEILRELSSKEQEEFTFYLEGHENETRIVDKIIFNALVMKKMLNSKERETKIYYEKIKTQWPEFIDWDLENSCFKINDKNFENIFIQNDDKKETTILTSLMSNVNLELLKNAILAFAFDCHNINSLPDSVEFRVKEKAKANWLKRFLKLDLKKSPFTEIGKIGYGMAYNKDYNTLFFNGIVKSDIKKKTIVFQIRNNQQKILKELWIVGNGTDGAENFSEMRNESVLKGKEYQIL